MKILLVGGGSGGHITPLIAIADKLKISHPSCQVYVISEKMGVFNHLFDDATQIDELFYINAGKFRRYHGQSFLTRLFDVKTLLFNIRDLFKLWLGVFESIVILMRLRPNVVFIKGGYIGVPVGLASRLLRIPYVTHDSDALPGLSNRLIAKRASINAVGMPAEHYSYPKYKTVYVGVPVTEDFLSMSDEVRKQKRAELYLKKNDFLLLITGGSNGAKRLDDIVHQALEPLLEKNPGLNIVHQVGKGNEELYSDYPVHLHSRLHVASFLKPLSAYLSAADGVIARAGATAIAEVGHQKTPLILVPNPYLAGGHQLKNADVFGQSKAAIVVNEHKASKDPKLLTEAIERIINSPTDRESLIKHLHAMTQKDSAERISKLLVAVTRKKGH